MKKGLRPGVIGFFAVALVATVLFASCGPSATGPQQEKKVIVSTSNDLSGPLAGTFVYQDQAQKDYFNMINDQGGINGVKIDNMWADCKYDLSMVMSNWKRFEAAGTKLHFSTGTIENEALADTWEQSHIACISPSLTPPLLKPTAKTIFCPTGNYVEYVDLALGFVQEDWQKAGKSGRPRVGYIGFNISATKPILDSAPLLAEQKGIDWGPMEFVPLRVLDTKAQVQKLYEAGANYVLISAMSGQPAVILKDAAAVGVLDKMKWIMMNAEKETPELAGDLAEGLYMQSNFALWSQTDLPGIKLMRDTQMKYHGKVNEEDMYVRGWLGAQMGCEAIRIALNDVGYDKLDSAAILSALNEIKNLDTGGITPAMTLTTPNQREASVSGLVCQVQKGQLVPVTDWKTPPSEIVFEGKIVPLP